MTNQTIKVAGIEFTDADIVALKAGEQLGGSLREGLTGPTVFTPSSSTPIQSQGKSLKPRIRDESGRSMDQSLVTSPRVDRFNQQAAERELQAIKNAEKATRDHENLDPSKLLASINAMDRRIRKIEKQLKEQQS